jgi:parallel beta helix pectate lyase-like protein
MASRTSCRLGALAAAITAALTVSAASALARPTAFDASRTPAAPTSTTILATAPFALGSVDLSSLGVPLADLAGAGVAGAASASAGDGPHMLIVDDNHADCPNAQFTRIQDAVDAAGPNDAIKVCPGTYDEQVTIGPGKDGLRLFSEVPLKATIRMPMLEATGQPRSIVTVNGSQDVSLWQFTITGPFYFPACAEALDRHTGVRIIDASATLFGNHITEIRNANPALFGCQDGIGVLVGRQFENQGGTATLRNNTIDLYQKGGVVVDGPEAYASITQNEIDGDLGLTPTIAQNGVQVGRGASANVDHNEIRNNFFFRIGESDSASGVLLFETAALVSVDHNDVVNNGVGIAIDEGSTGLTVDHNDVTQNHNDGIAAYTGSASNTISYNKATENVPVDCYDETAGPGTAGTANFWVKNMGQTENRPGLCRKATP